MKSEWDTFHFKYKRVKYNIAYCPTGRLKKWLRKCNGTEGRRHLVRVFRIGICYNKYVLNRKFDKMKPDVCCVDKWMAFEKMLFFVFRACECPWSFSRRCEESGPTGTCKN